MDSKTQTMFYNSGDDSIEEKVESLMSNIYVALKEKGYNPVSQIAGYCISGDPAYIPRHKDARNLIRKLERDELIEELVRSYLKSHHIDSK